MRRGCLAILSVLLLAALAAVAWFGRVGAVSHANYDRIRPGMSLTEVERLLGRSGTETFEGRLPRVVDRNVPSDDPKRIKAVVSGEHYFHWDDGNTEVFISLRGGIVAEKWLREWSL